MGEDDLRRPGQATPRRAQGAKINRLQAVDRNVLRRQALWRSGRSLWRQERATGSPSAGGPASLEANHSAGPPGETLQGRQDRIRLPGHVEHGGGVFPFPGEGGQGPGQTGSPRPRELLLVRGRLELGQGRRDVDPSPGSAQEGERLGGASPGRMDQARRAIPGAGEGSPGSLQTAQNQSRDKLATHEKEVPELESRVSLEPHLWRVRYQRCAAGQSGTVRLRERLCRSLDDSGTDDGRSRIELRCEEGEGDGPRVALGSLPLGGWNDPSKGRPDVGALGLLQGWTSSGRIRATKSRGAVDEVLQERPQREAVVCGEMKAFQCFRALDRRERRGQEESARERRAIWRALVEHGRLLLSRRRFPSPIPKPKVTLFS